MRNTQKNPDSVRVFEQTAKLVVTNQYSMGMALTWAAVKTGPSLQT